MVKQSALSRFILAVGTGAKYLATTICCQVIYLEVPRTVCNN